MQIAPRDLRLCSWVSRSVVGLITMIKNYFLPSPRMQLNNFFPFQNRERTFFLAFLFGQRIKKKRICWENICRYFDGETTVGSALGFDFGRRGLRWWQNSKFSELFSTFEVENVTKFSLTFDYHFNTFCLGFGVYAVVMRQLAIYSAAKLNNIVVDLVLLGFKQLFELLEFIKLLTFIKIVIK